MKKGESCFLYPEDIQVDHIFPKSRYGENSVLNATIIVSNPKKSNKKPSEFFGKIENEYGRKKLIDILKSHIIPEEALDDFKKNDLQNFLKNRGEEIIKVIKEKTKGS
ncbi:MAG: HNH endonuclease domain-containing protein [Candidatus Kryptonium sp.]